MSKKAEEEPKEETVRIKHVFATLEESDKIGTEEDVEIGQAKRLVENGWAHYANEKRPTKTDPATALVGNDMGGRVSEDGGWGKDTPGSATKSTTTTPTATS